MFVLFYFRIENSVETLLENLQKLWEKFLNTVISSGASDYLSVDHLALILQKLAEEHNSGCFIILSYCARYKMERKSIEFL